VRRDSAVSLELMGVNVTIQKNWQELIRPNKLQVTPGADPKRSATVVAEPLERGFGLTLGNALRRILLSSLQGASVQSVHIDGVLHEFSSIAGVREDVTDIVLNLKQVRLAMDTDEPQFLELSVNKKGAVKAGDIKTNQHVMVLNPDLHIATLTEDLELTFEFEVRMGKGYVPADMHEGLSEEIGLIKLDSSFAPVRKVAYTVEQARVGQMTNYDKLIIEVWTDGSVTPEDAIAYSAKIIKDQISVFINFDERISGESSGNSSGSSDVNENLFKGIDELELSVRATNCLKSANITLVGELVQKSENEMLKTKNFGRKSLDEIKRVLSDMTLDFGMKVDGFEKKYQEWKRKQQNEA
jgi:DNA-directed RNA polymerase subunit alpha